MGQIGPQMGQIWDFLRSVSVHFGSPSQNVLKLILKSPKFVTFVANLTQFGAISNTPVLNSKFLIDETGTVLSGLSGLIPNVSN